MYFEGTFSKVIFLYKGWSVLKSEKIKKQFPYFFSHDIHQIFIERKLNNFIHLLHGVTTKEQGISEISTSL